MDAPQSTRVEPREVAKVHCTYMQVEVRLDGNILMKGCSDAWPPSGEGGSSSFSGLVKTYGFGS